MGFIPRITCRRCGRQYSGIRSRCPYCGTRRVSQSDRAPSPTPGMNPETPAGARAAVNTKWQLIFGAILLVAVILAVIVLVSTTLNTTPPVQSQTLPPVLETTTPTPTPTPTPEPTPEITQLTVTYGGAASTDFTTTVGNTIQLTPIIYPTDAATAENVTWTSSNEDVATVEGGLITAVGAGVANIVAECYGVTYTTICRVRDA